TWHGRERDVIVLEADGDPLIGMSLLYGSRVTLDVVGRWTGHNRADAVSGGPRAWSIQPLIRVAGVILYREGRVLLQHRDDNPAIRWPGAWAIFGGHLEPGEEPEGAARREIEEELGLRLEGPLRLVCRHRDATHERLVFGAPLAVAAEELTLHEGQGMALLAPDEL